MQSLLAGNIVDGDERYNLIQRTELNPSLL